MRPDFAKGGQKGSNNDGGDGGSPDAGMATLGDSVFFDASLSLEGDQSCATCHDPGEGFAAPARGITTQGSVVEGSLDGEFGDRKPPTAAYATLAPIFDASGNGAVGGNFWDGRATGELLGNPAADQALRPFLNPAEQALPDKACVIWKIVDAGGYDGAWTAVWGDAIFGIAFPSDVGTVCAQQVAEPGEYVQLTAADRALVVDAYDQVALSIEAFESTLNTFSSRFDQGQLTTLEADGEKLFSSKGKCHQCHDTKGGSPLFTDFEFHNLGVPLNPANPRYNLTSGEVDVGLGAHTGQAGDFGKFKTPTVRNVAAGRDDGAHRTFMHNGSLVSLRQVVEFYNTRDVLPTCTGAVLEDPTLWGPEPEGVGCWPPPEYAENLDTKNMGNLGLTRGEVDAIIAFMEALTDQEPAP